MSAGTLVKRSGESRAYAFDFSLQPELQIAGAALTGTPTVTATPAGLTIGTPGVNAANTAQVTVRVGGGVSYTVYQLVCTCAVTSAPDVLQCVGTLIVDDG